MFAFHSNRKTKGGGVAEQREARSAGKVSAVTMFAETMTAETKKASASTWDPHADENVGVLLIFLARTQAEYPRSWTLQLASDNEFSGSRFKTNRIVKNNKFRSKDLLKYFFNAPRQVSIIQWCRNNLLLLFTVYTSQHLPGKERKGKGIKQIYSIYLPLQCHDKWLACGQRSPPNCANRYFTSIFVTAATHPRLSEIRNKYNLAYSEILT